MKLKLTITTFTGLIAVFLLMGFNNQIHPVQEDIPYADYKVTFIELGSVRCIPCQKMQQVMNSVEKKYGDQVNIIFYDVWTPEGKPFAEKYKIDLIPTQVLFNSKGEEFYRHEGYFPLEELKKVLKQEGVVSKNKRNDSQ